MDGQTAGAEQREQRTPPGADSLPERLRVPEHVPGVPDLADIEIGAPEARAVRWEVSCLPVEHPEYRHYRVSVEERGRGKWAVVRDGSVVQPSSETGNPWWSEVDPGEDEDGEPLLRDSDFYTDFETAEQSALRLALLVTVYGMTVAQAVRRRMVLELREKQARQRAADGAAAERTDAPSDAETTAEMPRVAASESGEAEL